jgi:hypothetical protein
MKNTCSPNFWRIPVFLNQITHPPDKSVRSATHRKGLNMNLIHKSLSIFALTVLVAVPFESAFSRQVQSSAQDKKNDGENQLLQNKKILDQYCAEDGKSGRLDQALQEKTEQIQTCKTEKEKPCDKDKLKILEGQSDASKIFVNTPSDAARVLEQADSLSVNTVQDAITSCLVAKDHAIIAFGGTRGVEGTNSLEPKNGTIDVNALRQGSVGIDLKSTSKVGR